ACAACAPRGRPGERAGQVAEPAAHQRHRVEVGRERALQTLRLLGGDRDARLRPHLGERVAEQLVIRLDVAGALGLGRDHRRARPPPRAPAGTSHSDPRTGASQSARPPQRVTTNPAPRAAATAAPAPGSFSPASPPPCSGPPVGSSPSTASVFSPISNGAPAT